MIKKLKPTCDLKYIYWPRNKPYEFGQPGNRAGPARNLGTRYATGKYLLFWDSDMIGKPNLLKKYLKKAPQSNEIVMGIRKNLRSNVRTRTILHSIQIRNLDFSQSMLQPPNRIDKARIELDYYLCSYDYPWNLVTSNNLMIKNKTFACFGGFDENFVFWGDEDQEFAYRLHSAGVQFRISKEAVGFHQYHEDESVDEATYYLNKYRHKNIFYKKHLNQNIYNCYRNFFVPPQIDSSRSNFPRNSVT